MKVVNQLKRLPMVVKLLIVVVILTVLMPRREGFVVNRRGDEIDRLKIKHIYGTETAFDISSVKKGYTTKKISLPNDATEVTYVCIKDNETIEKTMPINSDTTYHRVTCKDGKINVQDLSEKSYSKPKRKPTGRWLMQYDKPYYDLLNNNDITRQYVELKKNKEAKWEERSAAYRDYKKANSEFSEITTYCSESIRDYNDVWDCRNRHAMKVKNRSDKDLLNDVIKKEEKFDRLYEEYDRMGKELEELEKKRGELKLDKITTNKLKGRFQMTSMKR